MKKKLIFAVFIFTLNINYGQYASKGVKEISKILAQNEKIIAILTGDNQFDNALVYSLENEWRFCKWDTVSINNINKLNGIDRNQLYLYFNKELVQESSVMMRGRGVYSSGFQSAKSQFEYALIQKRDLLNYNINSTPLVYDVINIKGYEDKAEKIYYRLPIIIFNIQNILKLITEQNVKRPLIDNFSDINFKFEKLYCENAGIIKDKILLLNSDESKFIEEKDFKKKYPYKYEFATSEKIGELIKNRDSNYVFFHIACDAYKFITIYDLKTYVPLYSYINKNPMTCNVNSNINDIANTIKETESNEIKYNFMTISRDLIQNTIDDLVKPEN